MINENDNNNSDNYSDNDDNNNNDISDNDENIDNNDGNGNNINNNSNNNDKLPVDSPHKGLIMLSFDVTFVESKNNSRVSGVWDAMSLT